MLKSGPTPELTREQTGGRRLLKQSRRPTSRATSGTVEEFERAVQASKQNGQPAIWFYFRESASKMDTKEQREQRKKVLAFKEQVKTNGLPWTYKNPPDFLDTFRNQMILWLNARSGRPESEQN